MHCNPYAGPKVMTQLDRIWNDPRVVGRGVHVAGLFSGENACKLNKHLVELVLKCLQHGLLMNQIRMKFQLLREIYEDKVTSYNIYFCFWA